METLGDPSVFGTHPGVEPGARAENLMAKERVIIDCDPGVDDAVAIMLALGSPSQIEVLGITTVAGNVPLESTTRNALRVCEMANRTQIPVFAGCRNPMFPPPPRGASAHGVDGLGDIGLGAPNISRQSQHAVDFIIETVSRHPGEVTLCPIGPMTNIALALLKEPDIALKIRRIVFMGGAAFCPGNMTPAAEFNVWFDPHAAQITLGSGIPFVMFGLDVTNKAVMTAERINALRTGGTRLATTTANMMASYGSRDPSLHDACVIAYLLDPSLFKGVIAKVDVECESRFNRGRTIATVSDPQWASPDAAYRVITSVDDNRLFQLLHERLLSA